METIIKFLVSTAAGLEAATDTYRAVTQQQQALQAQIAAEQEAAKQMTSQRRPIGFHATISEKSDQGD